MEQLFEEYKYFDRTHCPYNLSVLDKTDMVWLRLALKLNRLNLKVRIEYTICCLCLAL
jgi:hypothetical protein